jgi:hypothetical protein
MLRLLTVLVIFRQASTWVVFIQNLHIFRRTGCSLGFSQGVFKLTSDIYSEQKISMQVWFPATNILVLYQCLPAVLGTAEMRNMPAIF